MFWRCIPCVTAKVAANVATKYDGGVELVPVRPAAAASTSCVRQSASRPVLSGFRVRRNASQPLPVVRIHRKN